MLLRIPKDTRVCPWYALSDGAFRRVEELFPQKPNGELIAEIPAEGIMMLRSHNDGSYTLLRCLPSTGPRTVETMSLDDLVEYGKREEIDLESVWSSKPLVLCDSPVPESTSPICQAPRQELKIVDWKPPVDAEAPRPTAKAARKQRKRPTKKAPKPEARVLRNVDEEFERIMQEIERGELEGLKPVGLER